MTTRPKTPFETMLHQPPVVEPDAATKQRARLTVAQWCDDDTDRRTMLEMLGLAPTTRPERWVQTGETVAKWDRRMAARRERWAAGATDAELASFEGVTQGVIRHWRFTRELPPNRVK